MYGHTLLREHGKILVYAWKISKFKLKAFHIYHDMVERRSCPRFRIK
tara:strand:+ start:382 stop:522 length:141 start_codon:yes stop_codon:yes gene_type:complete